MGKCSIDFTRDGSHALVAEMLEREIYKVEIYSLEEKLSNGRNRGAVARFEGGNGKRPVRCIFEKPGDCRHFSDI